MQKKQKRLVNKKKSSSSKRKSSSHSLPPLSKILFILGSICISIAVVYHVHQLIQLSFFNQKIIPVVAHRTSQPTDISIPNVDITLPVFETVIAQGVWQIADNGVSHLAESARPGENGTIIVYAHNTNDRFGPLLWVSTGQTITLTNKDKKQFHYTIKKIATVDPTDTKILSSQKGETLILYTCVGFADLKRLVIIAKPS
ncbi:MAG TPA: sortase [Patescibacteria group bacterium]|nr:sortase [Patescibacteria group bacterium]